MTSHLPSSDVSSSCTYGAEVVAGLQDGQVERRHERTGRRIDHRQALADRPVDVAELAADDDVPASDQVEVLERLFTLALKSRRPHRFQVELHEPLARHAVDEGEVAAHDTADCRQATRMPSTSPFSVGRNVLSIRPGRELNLKRYGWAMFARRWPPDRGERSAHEHRVAVGTIE